MIIMTEAEWLVSNHPRPMMGWMLAENKTSARKLRLLACAWMRYSWRGLCQASRTLVELVEEIAEGSKPSIYTILDDITSLDTMGICGHDPYECLVHASNHAANLFTTHVIQADIIRDIVGNPFRPFKSAIYDNPGCPNRAVRHPQYICSCPPWLTPTVLFLAQTAYDERPRRKCNNHEKLGDGSNTHVFGNEKCRLHHARLGRGGWCICDCKPTDCEKCHGIRYIEDGTLDPHRLSVLADALEEAGCRGEPEEGRWYRCKGCRVKFPYVHKYSGCEDCIRADIEPTTGPYTTHPIIAHLRSPGPHWRGCWVVDLLLRKE